MNQEDARSLHWKRGMNSVVASNISPSNKKSRILYVDYLRGFGILLMIMGHVGFGQIFDRWIHAFHMPLFFLVSGYLFRKEDIVPRLKKRMHGLLIPYAVFGVAYCAFYFLRSKRFDLHTIYLLCFENTADLGIPYGGGIWFLTALFGADIIYNCIRSRFENRIAYLLSAVVAVAGMAGAQFLPFRLPWGLDAGMVGVGFYAIGEYLFYHKEQFFKMRGLFGLLGLLLFSGITFLNGTVNMRTGHYNNWVLYIVNASGLTLSFFLLAYMLERIMNKREDLYTLNWLKEVGENSIVYLCTNQIAIIITRHIVFHYSINNILMQRIVVLLLVLLELTAFERLVMKTKIRKIFGK